MSVSHCIGNKYDLHQQDTYSVTGFIGRLAILAAVETIINSSIRLDGMT